jgi:enoyl-CoA hydratase/carnithine racemase
VTSDVKLSVMEIKWRLVTDMAGIALLRELVRGDVARELTYSGRIIDGDEAVRVGRSADCDAGELLVSESREQERLMGSPNQIEAVRAEMEQRPAAFEDLRQDP